MKSERIPRHHKSQRVISLAVRDTGDVQCHSAHANNTACWIRTRNNHLRLHTAQAQRTYDKEVKSCEGVFSILSGGPAMLFSLVYNLFKGRFPSDLCRVPTLSGEWFVSHALCHN